MPDITLPSAGAGVREMCTEEHRDFVQEVEDTLNSGRNEGSTPVDIPDCADIYVEHEEPIIANHIIIGEFDPETMTSENMKVSPNGDLMTLSTSTGGVTEMPGVFRPDAVARAREIIGAYTPGEPATDTVPPAAGETDPSRGVRLRILYNRLFETYQFGNLDALGMLDVIKREMREEEIPTPPSEGSGEGQPTVLTTEERLRLQQIARMLQDLMELENGQTPPGEGSGESAPAEELPNLTPQQLQLLEDLIRKLSDQTRERSREQMLRWY